MKRITLLITFISLLCISIKAQYYNVTVHINAGELKDSLTEEQLSRVQDLVVSGSMNYDDLALIQNNMPELKIVDLMDVDLDTIPKRAFYQNKSIEGFKLPLHIEYLDSASFAGSNIQLEVTGEFPGFGEGVGASGISISPDNEFCKVIRNCVYSTDGKVMYRCLQAELVVWVEKGTETIASRAFEGLGLRCIFFPSTLLRFETKVFENAYMIDYFEVDPDPYAIVIPDCMYFESKNPPSLAEKAFDWDNYTCCCAIRMPEESRDLYLAWWRFEVYGDLETEPYYQMAQINAGELKDSFTDEQLKSVEYLAVSGSMNYDDISLIQNKMPKLKFVDLRDMDLDTIPKNAFYGNKSIRTLRLPLHIEYLGDDSFHNSSIGLEVTGEYPRLGENVKTRISLSRDNKYCQKINGCIYSMDGKIMYHYDNMDLGARVEEGTEVIASRAFEKAGIRYIEFPITLFKIEENVFKNAFVTNHTGGSYHQSLPVCMDFRSQNPPSLAKDVFGMDEYTRSCYIWVPRGSRKIYQNADPQWKLFKIYEEGEPGPGTGISSVSQSGLSVQVIGSSLIVRSEQVISRVEVFNSIGKPVVSDLYNADDLTIPFVSNAKGLYVVKVYYSDHTFEIVKVIN